MEIKMNVKQVLIVRKDLGMRKGKMITQGAHAACTCMLQADKNSKEWKAWMNEIEGIGSYQRKITVGCDSEEQLLDIARQAREAGLNVALIKDAGLTELKVPTYTAVGIGPHWDERIDPITLELSLL